VAPPPGHVAYYIRVTVSKVSKVFRVLAQAVMEVGIKTENYIKKGEKRGKKKN
jgi:hypothetical protein